MVIMGHRYPHMTLYFTTFLIAKEPMSMSTHIYEFTICRVCISLTIFVEETQESEGHGLNRPSKIIKLYLGIMRSGKRILRRFF